MFKFGINFSNYENNLFENENFENDFLFSKFCLIF